MGMMNYARSAKGNIFSKEIKRGGLIKTIFKLYNIHCGFYDQDISEGIYEFHINIPVVAQSISEARTIVRDNPAFKKKQMHIDGIQEIQVVDGYRLTLNPEQSLDSNQTIVVNHLHRDL